MALDLAANVDEPAQERSLGYRTGRREILEELAADVLPEFQTANES